ncbi:MAG: sensor histidine kinase [Methylocystaceae bacterium]
MINLQLASELLDNNTLRNHYRLMKTLLISLTLILIVTAYLELVGLTSPAITYFAIMKVGIISYLILGLLYLAVKFFGSSSWTKWIAVISVVLILVVLRTAAHDAPETHALFFLAIILSLFYFDPRLTMFCTFLCMGCDLMLLKIYPELYPAGTLGGGIVIRYLNYLWVGIAGAAGTRATKELIEVAVDLREANVRLVEIIERERELEKMRKEFISQVSHELKSPLGLVGGYAEALLDDIKEEKRNHYLSIIIDEVKRMGKLINNMLSLSQLEGGNVKLRRSWFDLESLINKVTGRYSDIAEEREVIIEINTPGGIMVDGDPIQIEHVLENFVTNALRYTKEKGTIEISVLPEGELVRTNIYNEGLNIEAEDIERIWEPFYRADKSGNKKYGGTGLGLTVARTILQMHQSSYGFDNLPGGVQFYFYLPRIKEPPVSSSVSR